MKNKKFKMVKELGGLVLIETKNSTWENDIYEIGYKLNDRFRCFSRNGLKDFRY